MTYEIKLNEQFNSNEIYFSDKPSEAIRAALKNLRFRWNHKKSCWYGFASVERIEKAINEQSAVIAELGGHTEEGYMGATAWVGNKSHEFLWGAELTKALRADAKRIGLKDVSFRSKTFSGGQEVWITIKARKEDFAPFEEVKEEYMRLALRQYWWRTPDGKNVSKDAAFNDAELHEYNARLCYESDTRDGCQINHYHLDSYPAYKGIIETRLHLLKKLIDAYNYDDSNSMVDYFDTNFYYTYELKVID